MKSYGKWIIALCTLAALGSRMAWADENCQVSLSRATVAFTPMQRNDNVGSQQNWFKMPSRDINASIYCPQPQVMALFVHGAAGPQGRFLFGNGGGLALKASQMILDGRSYMIGKTTDRNEFIPADGHADTQLLHNNEAIIAIENNEAARGQQLNFTLTLTPVLNEKQFRNVSDNTEMESNLSWELLTH